MSCRSSSTPYDTNVVRFGTHQLREKVDTDNLLYVTWFAGGLRIMDINDPANPKERGYFIPKPERRRQRAARPTTSTRTTAGCCSSPTRSAAST